VDPRILPALWKSFRVTLGTMWRVARQFFHEATGAMFGFFALYGALAAWRQWRNRPALWLMCFTIAYTVMMAAFAFVSFRRARRVR
jgi:hypothetical protein